MERPDTMPLETETISTTVFTRVWARDRQKIIIVQNRAKLLKRGQITIDKPAGWGLPGGGVKTGETPVQAARRELREETGFDFAESEFHEVFREINDAEDHQTIIYDLFLETAEEPELYPNDPEENVDAAEWINHLDIYYGRREHKDLRIYSSHIRHMLH